VQNSKLENNAWMNTSLPPNLKTDFLRKFQIWKMTHQGGEKQSSQKNITKTLVSGEYLDKISTRDNICSSSNHTPMLGN
jgi:hypothetical protein